MNSGIAPVKKTGNFTQWLTRMPEALRLQSTSHANHLGTSVRNASVTTLYCSRRHHFKHLISKKEIFSNFWIMILNHLFFQTSRAAHGFNILVILICFVLELLELPSTINPLVNTDLGSSLRRTFHIFLVYILLSLSDIFCMIVGDLTITRIWEKTQLFTSSYSLNATAELFCLRKTLLYYLFPLLHK